MKLTWTAKQPTQEGWYVYREGPQAPVEVVHAFFLTAKNSGEQRYGSPTAWPPAYGYARPVGKNVGPLLVKRMHQPESLVEDGLGGLYLSDAGTLLPFPFDLEMFHGMLELPKEEPKKKAARKKATKKKAIELTGGEKAEPVAPAPDTPGVEE